jgi:hypothetical protein
MKRVFVVVFSVAGLVLVMGLAPAQAARHSGPESLAKGDGQVTTSQTQQTPIYRTVCDTIYIPFPIPYCYSGEVARQVTVTETSQSFSFSAKLGPKTTTTDPTDGAFGKMNLTTSTTVTTSVVAGQYYDYCNRAPGDPAGYIQPGESCPPLSGPSTSTQQSKATADVTCLNVEQNHAVIGGHVVKYSGDNAPTRGLLFNATDNTVARQQTAPDRFLGTFVTDVPPSCPPPGADAPISSGDILVDQS